MSQLCEVFQMDIDFEIIIKALGVVIGAAGTFYQVRNILPKSRSTLKSDLEILKLLEPGDPLHETVRRHVSRQVAYLYPPRRKKPKRGIIYSSTDFWTGVLMAVMFTTWTIYLTRDGFTWWAVLTGFVALGGLGGILTGLENPREKAKNTAQTSTTGGEPLTAPNPGPQADG